MLRSSLSLFSLAALSCASQPAAEPTQLAEVATTPHLVVEDDFEAARAVAIEDERPLLINFTSYTCVNCRMMEVQVFAQDDVATALAPYVEARLHHDASTEDARAVNAKIAETIVQSQTMPLYVAVDPGTGEEIARFCGLAHDPAEFVEFLDGASGRER
ncbi:MAG: thioredoxin family protein [Planctomycetota bacterium]